jgi:hypothetical protein
MRLPIRLRLMWAVLHGRSVAYRLRVDAEGMTMLRGPAFVAECHFTGAWPRYLGASPEPKEPAP